MMSDPLSRLPRQLYRAQDVQQLDKIAIEEHGIDGIKLMQRAGAVAFHALMDQWPQSRSVRVFAGSGKNGGDGYIVARLAQEQGLQSEVIQVASADKLQGDARLAWEQAVAKQVRMRSLAEYLAATVADTETSRTHTVIVDALLGTGIDRTVSEDYALAIHHINACAADKTRATVLAIDIPSGLNANTGMPFGLAVHADLTVTFIGMKQGLLTGRGREFAGRIVFSNLDVPDAIYSSRNAPQAASQRIDINDATRHLLPRAIASHKGDHGHVVVVGGDDSHGGAVLLAAEAALRSGAGLVSVITRSVHRPAILARRPELMVSGTEDRAGSDRAEGDRRTGIEGGGEAASAPIRALLARASAIIIGPGLGQSRWSRALFQLALAAQSSRNIPLVVDADGLRLLAEKPATSTGVKRDNWILTPHPGEAAQLLDRSIADIELDRFAAVRALQSKWGGSCLLKGSGSLICSIENAEQKIFLSTEGNPGMASAGMGDVLSGITGSLVAQGLSLADSIRCAVVIHGEAGDLVAQQQGTRGLLAADLFTVLPQLVNPAQAVVWA